MLSTLTGQTSTDPGLAATMVETFKALPAEYPYLLWLLAVLILAALIIEGAQWINRVAPLHCAPRSRAQVAEGDTFMGIVAAYHRGTAERPGAAAQQLTVSMRPSRMGCMGMSVGFTAVLNSDQLSRVAGPGAAGRVKSDDSYSPTALATSPSAEHVIRDAIDMQWPSSSFMVDVWANRHGDQGGEYLTRISMRVSNNSDRSDEVLDAKRAVMVAAVQARLGLAHLDTTAAHD